jgi:hypothetical protein
MRSALFWNITQRGVVIMYQSFGTTNQSKMDFLTLEDWTDRLSRNVGTEPPLYAA